ncbi:type II toxin-antitoxin system RelE/ParE family toxin, partial [Ralstonia pseudosolanacearum]
MRLAITPLAEQDLESIADYIAQDNPARAVTFVRDLREQCQRLV